MHSLYFTRNGKFSKALFNTLPHDLLIAKLNAYGLSSSALDFLYDYLTNRKQRCKVGSSFSSWKDITSGVPQGSVMGPLLFNFFLNDFFFFIEKSSTTNFADDNTIYASGDNIEDVIYKLETDIENALNWFDANGMVANPKKFQLMFLGTKQRVKLCLKIGKKYCLSTPSVILLGIEVDWRLNFNNHASNITEKAKNKSKSLARLRYKLDPTQKTILYHSYILSAFEYCPIIWMFCGKSSNEEMERVQKNTLRIIYNDYDSDFDTLLSRGKHLRIHEINKRKLLTEVYKCLNNLNPIFINDLFTKKNLNFNLRNSNLLELNRTRTLTYGLKSIVYRGSRAWNDLNPRLKTAQSLNDFKNLLKDELIVKCSCHLCQ